MKLNKHVETILGCDKKYDEADIVVFGAPFDSTTSFRPGARFAPGKMRTESPYAMESYSPYLDLDLEDDASVFDGGDLKVSFGDTQKTLGIIKDYTKNILDDGKVPLMLGGEHLVTLGAVQAMAEKYPDLNIVHFDAHADLRNEFFGTKYSHATVLRRCHDLVGDGRIFQFGIRSGDKEEMNWARDHVTMYKFDFDALEETLIGLEGKPIYFTVDLDVLDPSIFPGTGTPEAGGVDFNDLRLAMQVVSYLNVVGADMVELSPSCDLGGISTSVALKLLREFLLSLSRARRERC